MTTSSLRPLHRFLDWAAWPTYVFERAATLLLEMVLLGAGAAITVRSVPELAAAAVLIAFRLAEVEVRREEASVMARHRERGGITVAPLPAGKLARAEQRRGALKFITWLWPTITMLVAAAPSGRVALPLAVGAGATLARAGWSELVMPAWRRSRVAWRAAHYSLPSRAHIDESFRDVEREGNELAILAAEVDRVRRLCSLQGHEQSGTGLEAWHDRHVKQLQQMMSERDAARSELERCKSELVEADRRRR